MKQGFYTALGTPLDAEGRFFADSMANQIDMQIEAGVSGLLVMGSMGNEAFLRNEDYIKVATLSAAATKGRVPVLVGVTDVSVGRVLDRIKALQGIKGINGVVSTAPYYNACSQDEIFTFFNEIANHSNWPVYMYDLAVVAKTPIQPQTVRRLWKNKNIKGIKSGNLVTQRVLLRAEDRPSDFSQMFSTIDEFDVAYMYGLDKNLDGMFACTPSTAKKMYEALKNGNTKSAGEELDEILNLRDLFLNTSCLMSAFSYAMNLLGCPGRFSNMHQANITENEKEAVAEALRKMGEI